MKRINYLFIFFLFQIVSAEYSSDYFSQHTGQVVYRLRYESAVDALQLREWVDQHNLDVWSWHRDSLQSGFADVLLPAASKYTLLKALSVSSSIAAEVFIDDVEQRLREQLQPASPSLASDPSFFLSYHSYAEILTFLEDQQSRYPEFVRLYQFGTSVEDNPIMAAEIGFSDRPDLPRVILNGGIHAREWIGVATMTYLVDFLVDQFADASQQKQPSTSIWSQYVWTVVPVLNVDGYQFSWTNNRMWRKNRRRNSASCIGVDNNRNFPYRWGITAGGESSSSPCSEAYHGPSAASEPETQALLAFFQQHQARIAAYYDIHAYGELYLTPWGYTYARPPLEDYWLQNNCSTAAVQAIYQVHKQTYINGEGAATIYPTSGDTTDTSYGDFHIVYSQTLELRGPQGSAYGFLLPANQIIPQGQEFVAGLTAALTYIHQHPPPNLK